MFKHYMTKYRTDNKLMVTSWLQFNLLNKPICFGIKTLEIK